jgi:dethiobiotin synthetase
MASPLTWFITGTDTGVGKTVLTALLLQHLLRRGERALAIKPFATGSRADALLLRRVLQACAAKAPGRAAAVLPTAADLNPFFFRRPLAPLVAARLAGRRVTRARALQAIQARQRAGELLLVEGCGGLLTPLGPGYSARELIRELACPVVIVAHNRLGVLNQTLLAWEALGGALRPTAAVVLVNCARPDASAATNPRALAGCVAPTPVLVCPHLRGGLRTPADLAAAGRKTAPMLARLIRALERHRSPANGVAPRADKKRSAFANSG